MLTLIGGKCDKNENTGKRIGVSQKHELYLGAGGVFLKIKAAKENVCKRSYIFLTEFIVSEFDRLSEFSLVRISA